MQPELRQAIFERFRQGDGGINRKAGGTGLGLAIAKEFVEMHKGRIDVLDSDLGGARFEVTLPLQHGRPPAARTRRRATPASTAHVLDGLHRGAASAASRSQQTEAGAWRPADDDRQAARAGGRGQPRHEPLRRAVPGRRLRGGRRRSTAARDSRRRCGSARCWSSPTS